MDFIRITWESLEKDCIALAKKIDSTKIDEIVSISRGGNVVSRLLSDLLDLPISHIAIESYADLQQEKEPIITQVSSRAFKGENILLVDELADSGKTFLRGLAYLKALPISHIYTAAPYYKPHSIYRPDFWKKELDGWIIFPYEMHETLLSFTKMYNSKEKAKNEMQKIGFKEWEIQE